MPLMQQIGWFRQNVVTILFSVMIGGAMSSAWSTLSYGQKLEALSVQVSEMRADKRDSDKKLEDVKLELVMVRTALNEATRRIGDIEQDGRRFR